MQTHVRGVAHVPNLQPGAHCAENMNEDEKLPKQIRRIPVDRSDRMKHRLRNAAKGTRTNKCCSNCHRSQKHKNTFLERQHKIREHCRTKVYRWLQIEMSLSINLSITRMNGLNQLCKWRLTIPHHICKCWEQRNLRDRKEGCKLLAIGHIIVI